MSASAESFKAAFRRHPAGVAIVVGEGEDGPVGITASSVASVSAHPPILSFSLSRSGSSAQAIAGSPRVAVMLLTADHRPLAESFARSGGDRFTPDQPWLTSPDALPVVDGAAAVLHGRVSRVVPAGDSWLVLVAVDDVVLAQRDTEHDTDGTSGGDALQPLVYADRRWWTPAELRRPDPATGP
ncbi:flavin reductase family protein [Nocardioides bruguierae]|uniref:Flavin reductase family protein n=1 Tax=Nocardioides bruguierae TaxID=2945102 RepID=A0A9X2IF04_9ACTN|nr:flavin reductase family protein [Nocardioides bruguierae]MCL8024541.1 flavin reductase family protein [Nocardioides bruguierae]MCM0620842.1 flavin reductase family protein [Nocardioides bruguierae]